MLNDVREYIDALGIAGHTIGDDVDDDPILLGPDGRAVDTWRENYPYDERLDRHVYEEQKYLLQVEYNRAGVEHVMGFAAPAEYEQFMKQVPLFEHMLVEAGVRLAKYWFSVTQSEQRTRFIIRQVDPVRQWKLSPMDLQSLDKWDAYTAAKEEMFRRTDTDAAPWTTIKSNDKKRARINAMRHFLSTVDYEGKNPEIVGVPDPLLVKRGIDAVGD